MSFAFVVKNSGEIPSAGQCFLDVALERGVIKGGEVAAVQSDPSKHVKIKSVALVGGGTPDPQTITLSIEMPTFSIRELIGQRLTDYPSAS